MIYLPKRLGIRKYSRIAKLAAAGIALVFVAGCSTAQKTPNETYVPDSISPALRVVAVDLVSVLTQLPGYETWSMTTQVSPATSEFGEALASAIRNAGYGLQRVSADQGINYLEYRKNVSLTDVGEMTAFELQIRGVTVSRNYQWIGSRWLPSSAVRISGVEPTPVNVYNDLYGKAGITTKLVTGVEFYDNSGRVVASQASTTKVSGDSGEQAEEQSILDRGRSTIFQRQRALAGADKRTFEPVSAVTLRFPSNDPMVLGEPNKLAIMSILKQMDTTSDRFLIQGCSGQSLAWDGTEVLSLERQQRVNQELLAAGVQSKSIRETGCFQSDKSLKLTKQSVRLTLQRATQPL